ncbi:hypothetical protein Tco_0359766, partial [Tanacetum coccineum]
VINEFDCCKFIWDVLQTSKVNWKDATNENWYYGPNAVLLLVYLQYTKLEDMEITQCKWPGIRNWTYEDLVDREMIEMLNGKIGLVEVLEDDHEENENAEKNKLKEKSFKEFSFNGDEKLGLFVERFKKEFNKGMDIDENNAGSSGAAFWEDNEDTNMTTLDQNAIEREPAEKEEAKKEAAAKEREEAEKQKNQKRKEQAAAKKKEE